MLSLATLATLAALTFAPGQTAPADNTIEIVGNSGVSAQQLFLGTSNKVYIVDKTERNPLQVNGHPAWASEYDLETNQVRAMDILTNSFCAGGNVLGNGTWVNIGGNQPVTYGGLTVSDSNPYRNGDGGRATRTLNTCSNEQCEWLDDGGNYMTTRRWYPTLETLEDGTMIVVGGCDWGGFVNDASQNNPTYEFYPSRGAPVVLNILTTTLPANLFPLIWLLPSGNLFLNANWGTELFDYKNNVEYPLDDVPHSVRTYPGSAATAMLPLTPANNWTATIMFCGGTDLQPDQWTVDWNIAAYPADSTCVSMTPDVNRTWVDEDPLPEARVMGNWIFLPDGRLVLINGINKGTAGYGNTSWAIGQSYGDGPVHEIHYYDHSKPKGQRWSESVTKSTIDRMYHSSATLLPDGSIFSSGSNPNADYVAEGTPGYPYFTEYRVEKFYPDYFTKTRPAPKNLPTTLTYGGDSFEIKLTKEDLGGDNKNVEKTIVSLIRPGFSTHAMNMGQRYVQLANSFKLDSDGGATLIVSQVPPNPAILVPGPVLIYVVVNGVPSQGVWATVGNGQLGAQTVSAAAALPKPANADGSDYKLTDTTTNNSGKTDKSGAEKKTAAALAVMFGLVATLF